MVEARHLKPADYRDQPWKNGRGRTLEIASDSAEPFHWRVSTARIEESGEFSSFPDYQRTLVCLDGPGIGLSHDGKPEHRLPALEAYSFSGDWTTRATVGAPTQDFNVFALRDRVRAGVYPVYFKQNEEMQFPVAGREHFIFCVEGKIEVVEPNTASRFELEARETFRLSRPDQNEYLNLRAIGRVEGTRCLWVVIREVEPKRPKKLKSRK